MVPIAVALITAAGVVLAALIIARAIRGEPGPKVQLPEVSAKNRRFPRPMIALCLLWLVAMISAGVLQIADQVEDWAYYGFTAAGAAIILFVGWLLSFFVTRRARVLVFATIVVVVAGTVLIASSDRYDDRPKQGHWRVPR